MPNNPKVIIVAAGLGSRLECLTQDRPKCLLELNGKSILQHQLEVYHQSNISDISVVRGHMKECFRSESLSYFDNDDYKTNNILNSLFCAEEKIFGDVIVSYSDIIFEKNVLSKLLSSTHDISIVVDIDWQSSYVGRHSHPISEAETVRFDNNFEVMKIGKGSSPINEVSGEFIGLLKLSGVGAEKFKKHFHIAKEAYAKKPFQRAKNFQQSYLTDLMQEMVDQGVKIHCLDVKGGWKEIDTVEDYQNAIANLNG